MKHLLSILPLLFSTVLFAQQDELAEPFLNNAAKELDSGNAIEISFDYIRDDLQADTKIEGSGKLVLLGEKYMIDLDEAKIWYDGDKQYSLNLDIEEVYISTPDPDNKEFMFTDPITLLRNYKSEFKYRFIGDTEIHGLQSKEVQLYPIELGGPFALVKLFFNTKDQKLTALIIRHKQGILYTMILTDFKKASIPGENFFKFNQADYPNVDVIELMD